MSVNYIGALGGRDRYGQKVVHVSRYGHQLTLLDRQVRQLIEVLAAELEKLEKPEKEAEA